MKTILVTGCAGFIGSNFCRLYEGQFHIVGCDSLTRGSHPRNVSDCVSFHRIDICSEEALVQLFQGLPEIEGIINFAAESHVDHSLRDDSRFWATNVFGVRNLARLAIQRKIRLVQVSTDEVYGSSGDGEAFTEENPVNPRNPYAASKAAAELLLRSYREAYGLDVVITRGSNTLGPRQSLDKLVPKAIVHFIKGRSFPLFKTPARRMWLGVEDHCRGIKAVFEKAKTGHVYNISPDPENEVETSVIINQIRSSIGKGSIRSVDDRLAYDLRYFISSQKLKNELGWEPIQKLPDLLKETVRWYCDNPDWIETSSVGGVL